MKFLAPAITALAFAGCVSATHAEPAPSDGMLSRIGQWFTADWTTGWDSGTSWRVYSSPYTYHYSNDPDHKHVYSIGLERQRADGFTFGASYFRNSFGQPSAYAYVGQRFDRLAGVEPLFAQVTGGLLYGYKEPYNHKVPLNYHGFSPGIVPSVGWQFTPVLSAQLNFLGNSALMIQFSADFK